MRIHSKFKDYYDTALAYGHDDTIHYVRETKELDSYGWCPASIGRIYNPDKHLTITHFAIGFCGIVYFGIKIDTWAENYIHRIEYAYG